MAVTGPNNFALFSLSGISVLDTAGMPDIPVHTFKVTFSLSDLMPNQLFTEV
jgi:hypothetical protein